MDERKTNENLLKQYGSQFELVKHAIILAENMIKSHRAPRVKTDSQNVALQVIDELSLGKEYLDNIAMTETVAEVVIIKEEEKEEKVSKKEHKNNSEGKSGRHGDDRKRKHAHSMT